jgi:hypothetical protein
MSSLQQSWRNGQNWFCLEERGVGQKGDGRKERRQGTGGRNSPNNVCTYKYINLKKRK